MPESTTDYLTSTQAAELLDVSPQTITRWVREGYLVAWRSPSRTGNGRIRIPRSEVDRLLVVETEPAA